MWEKLGKCIYRPLQKLAQWTGSSFFLTRMSNNEGDQPDGLSSRVFRPIAMPDPFTGTEGEDWDSWLQYFSAHAEINGWNETDTCRWISVRLKGNAQVVFQSVPLEARKHYDQLVATLTARFAPQERQEVRKAEFKAKKRSPLENLVDFASAVRRLATKAYPGVDAGLVDELAKDQFIDGLQSREMRLKVREAAPRTLDDALARAIQIEAMYQAEAQRSQQQATSSWAETSPAGVAAVHAAPSSDERLLKALEELKVSVLTAINSSAAGSRPGRESSPRPRSGQRTFKCWHCDQPGHVRRDCPRRGGRQNFSQQRASSSRPAHDQSEN